MGSEKTVKTEPRHPQKELSQRLIVGEEIATGGMGVVLEAYDTNLKRKVALKRRRSLLSPEQIDPARGRLIEEAQITAQLDHPNIVAVYELNADEREEIFFTMKLVKGRELSDILREKDCQSRTAKDLFDHLQIFLKVCDTVAFAHSCGVIHRDLKPDNIMVGDFGMVYVMDWGLAQKKDNELTPSDNQTIRVEDQGYRYPSRTKDDSAAGTLWYMAPEQATDHGQEIDERTDVFQLGGLLYEILTHLPPYEARSKEEILDKISEAMIVSPQVRTDVYIPPRLSRIVMKALERSKVDRYQTVLELKQNVEVVMQGGGQFDIRSFKFDSIIFGENDPGDEAYIITSGRCRAFKTVDGEKIILREMGPGEVFGEIAVLTNEPRTASVEAIEPVQVQVLRREDFEEELGMGELLGSFMKTLAERFKEKDARVTELELEIEQLKSST